MAGDAFGVAWYRYDGLVHCSGDCRQSLRHTHSNSVILPRCHR